MARQLLVRIVGDDAQLHRAFTRSSRAAGDFDRNLSRSARGAIAATVSFRGLGRAIAFGSNAFLGGAGAVFALKQFISEAAQIQEEVEKTGVVFGRNAAQVQAWSKTLAGSFGVSEGAALKAAGTFGNMLRPLGFGTQAAAAMSERLVQLAADMASFNNTKPDVVLQALSSGLAGQVRPLRQYGVFLSQARIQQEALTDGITKNASKLTQAQKVQAAYNIILKDTKLQQGDVARNTESLSVAQSKLFAGLQDLEAALGHALLPSITAYVNKAGEWLNQTENQQRIQRDFVGTLHEVGAGLKTLKDIVGAVDKVTGSFKNTMQLLVVLKVASVVSGWATSLARLAAAERAVNEAAVVTRIRQYTDGVAVAGTVSTATATKVSALRGALLRLAAIGVITIGIEVLLNKKTIDSKVSGFLDSHGLGFLGGNDKSSLKGVTLANVDKQIAAAAKFDDELAVKALTKYKAFLESQDAKAAAKLSAVQGAGPHGAALLADKIAEQGTGTGTGTGTKSQPATGLTATQKNTFFDNAIARLLLRGGLGDIDRQIAALQQADAKIAARIKVTKDVTRKQNLEDELLQNQAKIKDLKGQQTADAVAKREAARQAVLEALQKAADDRAKLTAKQFRQLGLSATGDEITPGVAGLKKRLGQLSANVSASSLNTPKLQTELARFRKVLSEGLVPKDVRAKIKQMMDDIADQLKNSGQKTLTKFRHTNANALLAGLGLDAETTRILRQRLAQVGAGGTVPGTRSAAFAGAGANNIVVQTTVNLDGKKVAQNTTKHQRRAIGRRSESRRGPYAGRH